MRSRDIPEPPAPDWLSWAFWAQDHESIRDLVITIAALVGIPFVIWREWLHHRQTNAALEQAKVARQQAGTAQLRHEAQGEADRERRITDNFTRAVEQLASDKLETRLGAIYALERIARESKDDHWPIMETLTALVRERAPWPPKQLVKRAHEEEAESAQQQEAGSAEEQAQERRKLATDIQAVLTVISRRRREHEDKEQHLDLTLTNLQDARLPDAHLEGAELNGAHLVEAFLKAAHLEGAFLEAACLEGANLNAARLERTFLVYAHLEMANLEAAHLEGANLNGAHLEWAELLDAHLEGAELNGAHLEGARLICAHLEGAHLREAHLERADLDGAHLEGADLSNTDLAQEQFDSAITDKETKVPPHIKRLGKPAGEAAEARPEVTVAARTGDLDDQ